MKKKFTWIYFTTCILMQVFLIQTSLLTYAQDSKSNSDLIYGFDPLLYNGKVYYFYQPGTSGTQYLLNEFDSNGSVTLRDVTYSNLSINYDVYNQQLILKYTNNVGSQSLISFSDAWLDSFELGGRHFHLINDSVTSKHIYQTLGAGHEKVLYYLGKELVLDSFKNGGMRYFSDVKYNRYVFKNEKMINYKNNHGFVKAFEKEKQISIKRYIHEQKINVKKANDQTIVNLINYCSSLNKP